MTNSEFKRRFLRFHPLIYRISYSIVENRGDAEDLSQEVFIKLWQQRNHLDGIRNDEAFVVTVTKNMSLDMLRRGYRKKIFLTDRDRDIAIDDSPENRIHAKDELSAVFRCLKGLPPIQQKVIQLRHFAGMTIPEIAGVTKLTEVNIRQLLSRGRNAIKEKLNRNEK